MHQFRRFFFLSLWERIEVRALIESTGGRLPSPLPSPIGMGEGVKIVWLYTIQPYFSWGNWFHLLPLVDYRHVTKSLIPLNQFARALGRRAITAATGGKESHAAARFKRMIGFLRQPHAGIVGRLFD